MASPQLVWLSVAFYPACFSHLYFLLFPVTISSLLPFLILSVVFSALNDVCALLSQFYFLLFHLWETFIHFLILLLHVFSLTLIQITWKSAHLMLMTSFWHYVELIDEWLFLALVGLVKSLWGTHRLWEMMRGTDMKADNFNNKFKKGSCVKSDEFCLGGQEW